MAFLTMSMYSDVLQMDTSVNVLLPENRKTGQDKAEPDRKYPVVYLLHGHGDDHTAFIRKSNIELIARELSVVVVMPSTYRGFYTDNVHGLKYYTYFSEELPKKIRNFFPVSEKREDTFIAGNSMGGYGAFRIAMANPDKYAAAASLSGALLPFYQKDGETDIMETFGDFGEVKRCAYGTAEEFASSDNNLCCLVDWLNSYGGKQPLLYQSVGTEDLITGEQNKAFHDYLNRHGENLNYIYSESPGGHNWTFWNQELKKVFQLFGFKANGKTAWN